MRASPTAELDQAQVVGEERPVLDVQRVGSRRLPTERRSPRPTSSPTRDRPRRITRRSRVARTLRIGELTIWWTRLHRRRRHRLRRRTSLRSVAEVHVPGQDVHRGRRLGAGAARCGHPPHEVHHRDVAAWNADQSSRSTARRIASPSRRTACPTPRRTPARSTARGRAGRRAWRRAPMSPARGARTRRRRGRRPTPTARRRPSAGRQARGRGRSGCRSRPAAPGRARE